MKIVIVGDGKVGFTLSQQLSEEGHDIVIIDNKQKVLEKSSDILDVIGIQGNGANYSIQMEAGVPNADLLIAATSSDEINILSCFLAKKLGAGKTVARVRDPEYSESLSFLRKDLGLSMMVNPEQEAARQIARILQFPSAVKKDTFARGRVELVEIKLYEDSPLIGVKLSDLKKHYKEKVLVCAVQRGNEVFIPDGNCVLQYKDKITINGTLKETASFFKKIRLKKPKIKNVMIVGGSRIAFYLAKSLESVGMDVKIIEQDYDKCVQLSSMLNKALIIHGDGSDQEVLREEGLDQMDAFVSLTGLDEENIIISMYALHKNVPKVITKINRINYAEIIGSTGIDSVISPKDITAGRIIRYVRAMQNSYGSSIESMTRMIDNRVEALEFKVRGNFERMNQQLKEFKTKEGVLIANIVRQGASIIPTGEDCIMLGDSVVIVTTLTGLQELNDILA